LGFCLVRSAVTGQQHCPDIRQEVRPDLDFVWFRL
jgi:hypothetical protein